MASVIILEVLLFMCLCAGCTFGQENDYLLTDVCRNSGSQLRCNGNEILKIGDIRCLPSNYTCPEDSKIKRLCDGQRSCASTGLRQQLHIYCNASPSRTVVISYKCVPTKALPPCRTNICSNESFGLHCGASNTIHIIRALCNHGDEGCHWKVYHTLYTFCEDRKSCYASGLRLLMPSRTCGDNFHSTANVFVDYICIQENLVDDVCTGEPRLLLTHFAVIKSPGFPNNPFGSPHRCFWIISPGQRHKVEFTIHLAFSREFTANCDYNSLQVTYQRCDNYLEAVESFCWPEHMNIKRRSCGTVHVTIPPYMAGDDRGNRFLISYEVKSDGDSTPAYTPYMKQCHPGFEIPNATSVPYTSVSQKAPSEKRPRDTGKTMPAFYRLSIRSAQQNEPQNETDVTGDDNKTNRTRTISNFKPWRFLTIVKVVVINVFLFIIAVSLVVAIIYVCYRYKQVSKSGRYNLAPQSDTDSGRRTTSDTPLQTFTEEIEETQEPGNSTHSFMHHREGSQVYASLSEEPYATVGDEPRYSNNSYSNVNQNSRENGLSSFRPKQTNPYASYSSLDYDVPAEVHKESPQHIQNPYVNSVTTSQSPYNSPAHNTHSTFSSPALSNNQSPYKYQELDEEFPPPPEHLTRSESPNFSDEVLHYTINNDDYAIVQKPRKKPLTNAVPTSVSQYNNHVEPSASNHHNKNRPFSSDAGYLPHHQCMLSGRSCNVPPFIPQRQNGSAAHHEVSKHAHAPDSWDDRFY